jgi:hypothetical protein
MVADGRAIDNGCGDEITGHDVFSGKISPIVAAMTQGRDTCHRPGCL